MSNTEAENKKTKTVAVVMSTYNGSKNICRQLDSIFSQIDVNVYVVIRDDGSKDDTLETINNYVKVSGAHIHLITGKNEGYAKSFWDALCEAGDADYYAFSDQDDVWKNDKLIKTIIPMEESPYSGPKLSYCNMQRSDEELNRLTEQVNILTTEKLSKKICLTQTYNYGAATVFNKDAKTLICRGWPKGHDIPHDLWAGLLCYWFGRVFYVDDELYYWIRYGSSVTGEGTRKSGFVYRIKESLKKQSYPNVTDMLLNMYADLINEEDKSFLEAIRNYKHSKHDKLRILFDRDFKRTKLSGTIALKAGILLNWY